MKIFNKYFAPFLSFSILLSSGGVKADFVFLKQNSSPKYFASGNNEEGVCELIYGEIAKRLSEQKIKVKVDPVLYPVKRILAKIKSGEGHVFCGAGRNKKREAIYYYS